MKGFQTNISEILGIITAVITILLWIRYLILNRKTIIRYRPKVNLQHNIEIEEKNIDKIEGLSASNINSITLQSVNTLYSEIFDNKNLNIEDSYFHYQSQNLIIAGIQTSLDESISNRHCPFLIIYSLKYKKKMFYEFFSITDQKMGINNAKQFVVSNDNLYYTLTVFYKNETYIKKYNLQKSGLELNQKIGEWLSLNHILINEANKIIDVQQSKELILKHTDFKSKNFYGLKSLKKYTSNSRGYKIDYQGNAYFNYYKDENNVSSLYYIDSKNITKISSGISLREITFSYDGKFLITLNDAKEVNIFNLSSKKHIFSINMNDTKFSNYVGYFSLIRFDNTSNLFVIYGDRNLMIYNIHTNKYTVFNVNAYNKLISNDSIVDLAFTNESLIVIGRANHVFNRINLYEIKFKD